MSDLNQLRFGRSDPPRAWVPLRAGPISLFFDPGLGDLRYLRLGRREVVRRIYVAVRDRDWGTVPALVSNHHLEERDGGFLLRFLSVHRQREIAFAWAAEIQGDRTGRITFAMSGQALSTFMRNRIGICVLHPAHESAGLPCTAGRVDGTVEEGAFPLYIKPTQPFCDIGSLTFPIGGEARAALTFMGDVFEMEDQRNWTDASFKTYSTPIDLPYPREIRANTNIRQSVTLSLAGVDPALAADAAPAESPMPTVSVGRTPLGPRPALGLGLSPEEHGDVARERLRSLGLAHLRLDLDLGREWRERLAGAADLAQSLAAPLELALFLPGEPEAPLVALAEAVQEQDVPLERVLVFDRGTHVGGDSLIGTARAHLGPLAPAFGGGADGHFVQLNRDGTRLAAADLVTYSLHPQVHAFDHVSMVETLPTQAWTVASTQRLYPHLPLVVSPVTLKSRPDLEEERGADSYDRRQRSLFAAAWTVGSLKYLAEAGVRGATYFETVGPGGVMDSDGVFPLYHVFADALEAPQAAVLPTLSSDALRVEALALRCGFRTRVIVANLTLQPQSVQVTGLGQWASVRRLDESTADEALTAPETFRSRRPDEVATEDGSMVLEIPACGLATIDTW